MGSEMCIRDSAFLSHVEFEIHFEQRICESYDHSVMQEVSGAEYGVRCTQRLVLIADVARYAEALRYSEQLLFYLFTKIFADDKDNIVDLFVSRFDQVFHQSMYDWFAGYRQHWFRDGECVRPQAGTPTRHRDNDIHAWFGLVVTVKFRLTNIKDITPNTITAPVCAVHTSQPNPNPTVKATW